MLPRLLTALPFFALLFFALGCRAPADPTRDAAPEDAATFDVARDADRDPREADADGVRDSGRDTSLDAVDERDTESPETVSLLTHEGCFFSVDAPGDTRYLDAAPAPSTFSQVKLELTFTLGGWRSDLFDRAVLSHILFGLLRDDPLSRRRYVLGLAAQMKPPLRERRAIFYGRVDMEERAAGEGHTAYVSFRENALWEPGETYRAEVVIDVPSRTQRLRVFHMDTLFVEVRGEIDYFTEALTRSTFRVQVGHEETDHRDVTPVGATFCDLSLVGHR